MEPCMIIKHAFLDPEMLILRGCSIGIFTVSDVQGIA